MEVDEHVQYCITIADHDLEAADALFAAGRYDWCLILGHLVLEKALKALYVRDNQNRLPPKTHNLVRLAEETSIPLNIEQEIFLDEVNDFNIETRYPDYKHEFYKRCTKDYTRNYFHKIKEQYEWVKSLLGLVE